MRKKLNSKFQYNLPKQSAPVYRTLSVANIKGSNRVTTSSYYECSGFTGLARRLCLVG